MGGVDLRKTILAPSGAKGLRGQINPFSGGRSSKDVFKDLSAPSLGRARGLGRALFPGQEFPLLDAPEQSPRPIVKSEVQEQLQSAIREEKRRLKRRKGTGSTILTGSLGLAGEATTGRKRVTGV